MGTELPTFSTIADLDSLLQAQVKESPDLTKEFQVVNYFIDSPMSKDITRHLDQLGMNPTFNFNTADTLKTLENKCETQVGGIDKPTDTSSLVMQDDLL